MEVNKSKTIKANDGKILFFGLQHFLDDIAKGDCCFICGAKPGSKEFNNEHIIPDWILSKFNLHSEFITLTNGTRFRYGEYTVPCCKDCNSELGVSYEAPIGKLLSRPYNEIIEEINQNQDLVHFLFRWMCLVFFKTHLKDKALLKERDRRKESGFLGDLYGWEDFHHIHCIARSHYTKAIIEKNVYGTILILPAFTSSKSKCNC